jgi:hypothetical protein
MKKVAIKTAVALATTFCALGAQAGDVYGGIGFPGLTLGYAHTMNPKLVLRGEFSGGLDASKDGKQNGVDFNGKFKAQTIGGFADYFPMDNGFRLTGGLTVNDTSFSLNSKGGAGSTVAGKAVNLTGETFNVELKFPNITPYLGIGYGFKPSNGKGWGFYGDIGFLVGKFDTKISTSIINKQGVVGAGNAVISDGDVRAEGQKIADAVSKLSVLPKFSIGASYSF